MLTKLGGRGYFVEENRSPSRWELIDSDPEKFQPQPDI
jgi:hypothetical protein